MKNRKMSAISLLGRERIHESYLLTKKVYGRSFDARMAELALIAYDLKREIKCTDDFNGVVLQLIVTHPGDEYTTEKIDRINHEFKALILWNALEFEPFHKKIKSMLAKNGIG